ncbi:MAG: hypothetical protein KDL87_18075 [Verrucomicrobiae bacterium]|nr:hypothetical protein [Verrucomicrobiae bacterium]
MSTLAEIEEAIRELPDPDVERLADWLDSLRQARHRAPAIDEWLNEARGAALPGVKTDDVLAQTRGEE